MQPEITVPECAHATGVINHFIKRACGKEYVGNCYCQNPGTILDLCIIFALQVFAIEFDKNLNVKQHMTIFPKAPVQIKRITTFAIRLKRSVNGTDRKIHFQLFLWGMTA
jgi:hypothetical protein